MVRHRAWHDNSSSYVYWLAPKWDPTGVFYEGPPPLGELSDFVIVENDVTVLKAITEQSGAPLLDGVSGETSDPVEGGDSEGVNIEGFITLNFYWAFNQSSSSAEVLIWLYDGNIWVPVDRQIQRLDNDIGRGVLDPFDQAGGYSRVGAEVVSANIESGLDFYVTPHN